MNIKQQIGSVCVLLTSHRPHPAAGSSAQGTQCWWSRWSWVRHRWDHWGHWLDPSMSGPSWRGKRETLHCLKTNDHHCKWIFIYQNFTSLSCPKHSGGHRTSHNGNHLSAISLWNKMYIQRQPWYLHIHRACISRMSYLKGWVTTKARHSTFTFKLIHTTPSVPWPPMDKRKYSCPHFTGINSTTWTAFSRIRFPYNSYSALHTCVILPLSCTGTCEYKVHNIKEVLQTNNYYGCP